MGNKIHIDLDDWLDEYVLRRYGDYSEMREERALGCFIEDCL
ncbi:MAG: hypothetical protein ACLTAI_02590 [Thomasclavelia sp.]